MRGPCQTCLEHGRVRPMREVRRIQTEGGWLYEELCGPHSSALTISLARQEQEARAVPRECIIHKGEDGQATVHEVN